jgi:hypothetical protein
VIDAEKIANYIAQPGIIDASDLEDIATLADKFPYTSLFSLLYLKGLKANKSLSFEEKLKEHSYRISDRVQLYQLINETVTETVSEEDQEVHTEEIVKISNVYVETPKNVEEESIAHDDDSAITEDESSNTLEEEGDTTIADITFDFGSDVVSDQTKDIDDASSDNDIEIKEIEGLEYISLPQGKSFKSDEDESVLEEVNEAESDDDDSMDELEENLAQHLIASGYHLKPLSEEEERTLEEKTIEQKPEASQELEPKTPQETKATDNSFISWLHADVNYEPVVSEIKKELEEFDPLEDLSGEVQKPKTEFFSPTKKAKESLQEETIPVSETLAKVFVLQGNYPKAIQVYEELCLKFPEKKTFFADSIKEIKKKLNIK